MGCLRTMKWRALEINSGTVNEFGDRTHVFGDRIYEFGERVYRFEDRAHGLEDRTVGVRCRTDGLVLQAAHPAKSCIAGAGLLRTSEPGAMIRGSPHHVLRMSSFASACRVRPRGSREPTAQLGVRTPQPLS